MKSISVDELKAKMDKGDPIHLLDVRESFEHAEFNIGGILLPLSLVLSMQVEAIEDLKEEELIIYCRSGNRSGQACQVLDILGFTNTNNLAGGMLAWKEKYEK